MQNVELGKRKAPYIRLSVLLSISPQNLQRSETWFEISYNYDRVRYLQRAFMPHPAPPEKKITNSVSPLYKNCTYNRADIKRRVRTRTLLLVSAEQRKGKMRSNVKSNWIHSITRQHRDSKLGRGLSERLWGSQQPARKKKKYSNRAIQSRNKTRASKHVERIN